MELRMPTAEIYIPDGLAFEKALQRTTHLAISAHQDDIEIMATAPILACYQRQDLWFAGVVMTDGRGSPRDGIYKDYTDEAMRHVRYSEQRKAANLGEYTALVFLDYPSGIIKDATAESPNVDLIRILKATHPDEVYTHNLADKHDTHVSTALRVIAAIRNLPKSERPHKLYGCEVWRDLDWMVDDEKVGFDLSARENLQSSLLGVYDSQISGGKRYDLASLGRRRANATYFESHQVDVTTGLSFAMDLSPLISDPTKNINDFVQEHIQHFAHDVADRLTRLGERDV